MPTDLPAPRADVMSPRRAFLMVGMSDRRGVDEEAARGAGDAIFEEVATPKALASRFADNGVEEEVGNKERAATAGGPLLTAACPPSLIARRSARDRFMPGRTDKFFERDAFGAIALKKCSDTGSRVWCACGGVPVKLKLEPAWLRCRGV